MLIVVTSYLRWKRCAHSSLIRLHSLALTLLLGACFISNVNGLTLPPAEDYCTPEDPHAGRPFVTSPDINETYPDGSLPQRESPTGPTQNAVGPIAPAPGQPAGSLSGRIVFTSSGHGWTAGASSWSLQRSVLLEMNEDYGNVDQMNYFATYCFNAGATVVPFRPIGYQTNEVVLDNDSPGVTFVGAWSDSSQTIFYGSSGDVPYRFASIGPSETATATYVPNIPAAGFYPVYTWVRFGTDRTSQLYRIRHTGGESQVRVPHYMVGNGWVYLGMYYFNAGSDPTKGAVVISNLEPAPSIGTVVIADAIRFGNGLGDVDRGFGVSTFPSEEECSRYWVQRGLGQGQSPTLYDPDYPGASTDDGNDNVGTPPRMAREMNTTGTDTNIFKRILISFHSNAGGGRGVVGLWNDNSLFPGSGTPNQFRLAQLCGTEVNNDLVGIGTPPLEVSWFNRGSGITFRRTDFAFGEIHNSSLGGEMDATIVEVAFHDDASDAALLRDPKVRNWVGRATYQAVVRYMNEFDAAPLVFLPEPPGNVRALATGTNITVSWSPPVAQAGSGAASGYLIYQSADGYGFGNPVAVSGTSLTLSNLAADTAHYFRVAATNSGGQSMPSETVAGRFSANPSGVRVVIVNAYDRFDRTINIRQTPGSQNYKPPGHDGNSGTMDRAIARWNNAFDHVVAHAKALATAGVAFDSCQNESLTGGQISLTSYPVVIWASGQESTVDETFNSVEQSLVSAFLNGGGGMFVSGSDIAWDLDRSSGPTASDRAFFNSYLHADLGSDANDDSGIYSCQPAAGSLLSGKPSATFDSGSSGIYAVRTPDVLTPFGTGATKALTYTGGSAGAAIQYDGSAGGGPMVYFGFPFETITSELVRADYMASIVSFLSAGIADSPAMVVNDPEGQQLAAGANTVLSVQAAGTLPIEYQWWFNNSELPGQTADTLALNNAQFTNSGLYYVVVSNAFGMDTSAVALVEVTLPPTYETVFSDDFDVNAASDWVTNRSSTDTRVTFNYDYAADGIPSAPHSIGGTTRGVKFEANMVNGVAAAINISPFGHTFGGDYRLRFDMWINANGPFPAGGFGSTEHFTAGIGTSGTRVQWTGTSSADGYWFAVDGEGGSSDSTTTSIPDFGAFTDTSLSPAASGDYAAGTTSNSRGNGHPYYTAPFPGQSAPAFQQSTYGQQTGTTLAGTVGLAWRDVIISKLGDTVEWFIDGLKIATFSGATFNASNVFIGYWDSYASISDNVALSFGLADNVRIERLVIEVPPYITAQPMDVTTKSGSNVAFSVNAGGTATLAYQWRFNGTNINGATTSSHMLSGVLPSDAGSYSVIVTNAAGTVTSADAFLTITPSVPLKFDLVTRNGPDQVKLLISGEPGLNVGLYASTNLIHWSLITNLPNPAGLLEFIETIPSGTLERYYRAQSP